MLLSDLAILIYSSLLLATCVATQIASISLSYRERRLRPMLVPLQELIASNIDKTYELVQSGLASFLESYNNSDNSTA
jgi:hypothetical protein